MSSSFTPSRRAVTTTAAWSAPVLIAGATASTLAASNVTTTSMSKTILLDVSLVNVGVIGTASLDITGTVPTAAHVGDTLTATFTGSLNITEPLLASMRASTGTGTADNPPSFGPNPARPDLQNVKYTVAGPVAAPGAKSTLITFDFIDIPQPDPANVVTITVPIAPPSETASATGTVTAVLNEIENNLSLRRPDGTEAIRRWLKMTPQAGQDATLFSAQIFAAGTPLP